MQNSTDPFRSSAKNQNPGAAMPRGFLHFWTLALAVHFVIKAQLGDFFILLKSLLLLKRT